ncbi:amidohydrolase family protein [Nocardia sp. CA-119907]|uniref:amidohydrolase family protein n=1 Tax=Nocardia sp. CA-119907 TaxID=3239973 RepID=UPI003D98035B
MPHAPAPTGLALTNALLIDGTGGPAIEQATIVIADGRVVSAGPEASPPAVAEVLDLQGRTVLPGLIDAHVHLGGLGLGATPPFGGRSATDDYAEARASALRYGVTTQRSLGDFLHDALWLRDETARSALIGPRIMTSGPSFQVEGGHPNGTVWGGDRCAAIEAARMPRTPEQATRSVDELAAAGVDLIKIIISNNAFFGRPPNPELKIPWAITEAIIEAAHRHGLRVAAHVENLEDCRQAVLSGVDDIEHLLMRADEPQDADAFDELFELMIQKGTYLVPTVAAHQHFSTPETDARTLQYGNKLIGRAFELGVTLGVGSDAHSAGLHGWKLLQELVMLVHDQGIPALAALSAATKTNAELLGIDERLGTVEPGKTADLLVVDGNPLTDITAIQATHYVIQDGAIVIDRSRINS